MPQYLIAAMLIVASVHPDATAPRPGSLRVLPEVDYQRYAGTWYEIARLPNRFHLACASDVTATYALRSNGRIAVTNRCRQADGNLREAQRVPYEMHEH